MVGLRNFWIDTDPNWMYHVEQLGLVSVVVHGYGSELSAADRQWFKDHLYEFIWD